MELHNQFLTTFRIIFNVEKDAAQSLLLLNILPQLAYQSMFLPEGDLR